MCCRIWIVVGWGLCLVAHSGVDDQRSLTCRLVADKDRVIPFEPVGILITLENETDETITIETDFPWSVSIWDNKKKSWRKLYRLGLKSGLQSSLPREVRQEVFKPGRQVAWLRLIRAPVFSKPGRIRLVAEVAGHKSEPVEILVQKLPKKMLPAYRFLEVNPELCNYFHELGVAQTNQVQADKLQAFCEKYPKSRYGMLGRYGLILIQMKNPKLVPKIGTVRDELKKLSTDADDRLRSKCTYYIGKTYLHENDIIKAHDYFDRALKVMPSQYLQYLINRSSGKPLTIKERGGMKKSAKTFVLTDDSRQRDAALNYLLHTGLTPGAFLYLSRALEQCQKDGDVDDQREKTMTDMIARFKKSLPSHHGMPRDRLVP